MLGSLVRCCAAALVAGGAVDGGAEVTGASCDGELRSVVVGCDASLVAASGIPAPASDGVAVLAQPVTARASTQANKPTYPHPALVFARVPDPRRTDRFCGIRRPSPC